MIRINPLIWHTDCLNTFNTKLYKDVLTLNNVSSGEVSKTYQDQAMFGYELEQLNNETKLKETYFISSASIHKLPIRVMKFEKFSHKGKVYKLITDAVSIKIPSEKKMEFRELIDSFASYKHSNDLHWKLAKIIIIASYCDRLNIRIVSEASFGKDALVDMLNLLMGDVSNLYNATLAKLKYSLRNRFVVLNEMGGLKDTEIKDLQVFLMQAGAYKARYENNSRRVDGTREVMDIDKLSLLVYHNVPVYYKEKSQAFFEEMFTEAIMDRFPPLLLNGWVREDFTQSINHDELIKEHDTFLKDFISTLNYYKNTVLDNDTSLFEDSLFGFTGKERQRSLRSFKTILKWIREYASTDTEFLELAYLLVNCKDEYKLLVNPHPLLITEVNV